MLGANQAISNDEINMKLNEMLGKESRFVWWINPINRKSISDIWHIHVNNFYILILVCLFHVLDTISMVVIIDTNKTKVNAETRLVCAFEISFLIVVIESYCIVASLCLFKFSIGCILPSILFFSVSFLVVCSVVVSTISAGISADLMISRISLNCRSQPTH